MVEFGDLLPFKSVLGVPLLGLCEGHRDESVISTNKNGVITVYDVPTRLAVLSWKLTNPDTITVPVCFVAQAGLYMAVKNDNELIYWDPSITFAADFKVLQLSHTVHSLLLTPSNTTVVVVCENNSLELLKIEDGVISIVNRKRKKIVTTSQMSVEHSLFITLRDTPTHLIVIGATDCQYSAILYSLTDNDSLKELGTVAIGNGDNGDLSVVTSSASSLYLTWSGGCAHRVDLNKFINKLECDLQLLPELGSPTGLTCFNNTFVITLSGRCLKVYENKYHTLQTNLEIKDSIQRLGQCYHGYLFLFGSSGALIGCPMSVGSFKPSLANALGKCDEYVTKHCANEEGVASSKLTENIERFLAPSTSHKDKYKACRSILKHHLRDHLVMSIILQITKFLLEDVVSDCKTSSSSPSSWYHKELLDVIRAGVYPISLSGILYSKALQSSDWSLIFESIEYVNCIPEDVTVQILDSLLSLPDEFSLTIDTETYLKDQLLWKILSLPRNDVLLLKPLAKMSQISVIALVELLSQHIDTCFLTVSSPEQWGRFEDSLDWISLILDSHFTRLILIPSVHPNLLKLRSNIWKQMRTMTNLSLLGAVDYALKTSSTRNNHSNWLYKLDRLELDF